MEVILLERVAKLGQIGDVVRVRDGFARNFLLAQGKALRATEANRAKFETMKSQLEARNLERKGEADAVGKKLEGAVVILLRQAGEAGQLYGSVSTRDIAQALVEAGYSVDRRQIVLNAPIKSIGMHKVPVQLHPEVEVTVTANVARSTDEAERQARGEDLTKPRTEEEEGRAQARVDAGKFFEQRAEADADAPAEPDAETAEKPKKRREKAAKTAEAGAAPTAEKPVREKKAKREKAAKEPKE